MSTKSMLPQVVNFRQKIRTDIQILKCATRLGLVAAVRREGFAIAALPSRFPTENVSGSGREIILRTYDTNLGDAMWWISVELFPRVVSPPDGATPF